MRGRVRTNERCPFGCKYGKELECVVHKTRPKRYYVDTSGFKLPTRKLYRDREGRILSSRDLADRMLTAMRVAFDSRAGFNPADWEPSKLREFKFETEWDKFVEARKSDWSHRYVRQVDWIRTRFLGQKWSGMDVRDIRNAHLIDLKTWVAGEGYAPSVVKLVIGITMSFLGELRLRGDISAFIARPTVKVPQRDLVILTADQQEAIISCAPARYRSIFRLATRTGVRPCEVCAVRVRDVAGGFIHFQRSLDNKGNLSQTKTGAIHRKPVPNDMADEIAQAMRSKLPEAFLFTGRTGAPHKPGILSRVWKKASEDAGIKSSLYVGTRHSFATRTWKEEEKEAKERTARALGDTVKTTFGNYVRRA